MTTAEKTQTEAPLGALNQTARRFARNVGLADTIMAGIDFAPKPHELSDLAAYRHRVGLWRALRDGGYTMLSCRRGRTLNRLAADVEERGIPGAIVDCGVFNGGSTTLLSAGAPSREIWAFDSFEGLPEPGPLDGEESVGWKGECHGSEDKLREAFRRFAHPERLHVVKGWFEDTFPVEAGNIDQVAVLHADGDWYDSVKLTLETFYDKIPSGGYIAIDDYGHWQGGRIATDEFREKRGIDAPLHVVDDTGVYWQKA